VGDLLHTFSRREYRALSRTSHASAASSGTPRSRLLLSAGAAVMTVSGRASYVRQHECHTSTTPAVLLLIRVAASDPRSPITMDQSQLPDLR
jgi:hypothetical protein